MNAILKEHTRVIPTIQKEPVPCHFECYCRQQFATFGELIAHWLICKPRSVRVLIVPRTRIQKAENL